MKKKFTQQFIQQMFQISNLRTATPATVSRAGILYINPGDLGWNPFVTSWIETRENQVTFPTTAPWTTNTPWEH